MALDEDSPYTSSCLFTLERLLLLLLRKNLSSSAVQKRHSKVYGNPIAPSYSIHLEYHNVCTRDEMRYQILKLELPLRTGISDIWPD